MIKPVNKKLSDLMDIDLRYWNYGPCDRVDYRATVISCRVGGGGRGRERERVLSYIFICVMHINCIWQNVFFSHLS